MASQNGKEGYQIDEITYAKGMGIQGGMWEVSKNWS